MDAKNIIESITAFLTFVAVIVAVYQLRKMSKISKADFLTKYEDGFYYITFFNYL